MHNLMHRLGISEDKATAIGFVVVAVLAVVIAWGVEIALVTAYPPH